MNCQSEFHNLKLEDIYNRIGEKIGARTNKKGEYVKVDIAKALKADPQDISNWAFRNKFPWMELFVFAQEHKMSFDLLLTGTKVDHSDCPLANCDETLKKYCQKVKEIIESPTTYSGALKENITAFHEAVGQKLKSDKENQELREALNDLKREFDTFKAAHSPGPDAGTQAKPVARIGKRRKAG